MLTLASIVKTSLIQFFALFGPLVGAGLLMTIASRWINNSFQQFVAPKAGLYLFGTIGIPVHEFSHVFFCKLFFHKIGSVKWFDHHAKGGSHGAVVHHYNPWNPYHRVGHFFIGLGPAILGPVLLAVLFYILVPQGRQWIEAGLEGSLSIPALMSALIKTLLTKKTLTSPAFYVFLYLSACITSQIELSREDVKQALTGVIPILFILLVVNVFFWSANSSAHAGILSLAKGLHSLITTFLALASLMTLIHLILFTMVMSLLNLMCGHRAINPFRRSS